MDIAAAAAEVGTTRSIVQRQLIADNLDTFLKLLTTQLKNQNPLEPLDTNEFTAQLVQFSQVEQSVKSNDFLEKLVAAQAGSASQTAVGYIGKLVTADGATTRFENGRAAWALNATADAEATFVIRDAAGSVVHTVTRAIARGDSALIWDGTTSTGEPAREGLYTLAVSARDAAGRFVAVGTEIKGLVRGVEFAGGEPMLDIGGIRVRLSSISSVQLPDTD